MNPLETELEALLDNVRVMYLRVLAYPPDDWYGQLERRVFFQNNPQFEHLGHHRLREMAKALLDRRGD